MVRHGQTQWNVENRMATFTNVPLTSEGVRQAEALGEALRGAEFDAAFTSPLDRARVTGETALRHAQASNGIEIDERLVEPSGGPFEGDCFDDLYNGPDPELRAAFASFLSETDPVFPAGAENLESSSARAHEFVGEIAQRPGRYFASTHGGFARILACEILNLNAAHNPRLKLDNCHSGLFKFWPTPPFQYQLVGWNLPPV
ncbi:MAG: histidine phosphatase family protein [Solirubrobacteraceae bacterium]